MRSASLHVSLIVFASVTLAPAANATCGGGGGGGVGGAMPAQAGQSSRAGRPGTGDTTGYNVPWRYLEKGVTLEKTTLTLYWIPAGREEMKKSGLLGSRELTLDSAQCLGLAVVLPEDSARIEKLGATGKLPQAVLVGGDDQVLRRVENVRGVLRPDDVAKMVRDEFDARDLQVYEQVTAARKKAAAGDKSAAIDLYKKVWDQRCMFPAAASEAKRALQELGTTVADARSGRPRPNRTASVTLRITSALRSGLDAEAAGDYQRARARYLAARRLDPGDPTPLRYLGELYRHHTGEWDKARAIFEGILAMPADPLARAVALHGLGKMTIHAGDYARGLAMFQQSIDTYPLALTYRNLAVYWNSERNHAKAYGYVQKALELDPEDPYNLIFAATYMADSGRPDEALRIARKNESIMAASYNLAAIYALLGNRGKAMELLRRHFYSYERYDAVREKEMMEARVDYVFESLRGDPEFQKLTADAR